MDERSVLPKIKKMQENMKKIINNTQTTSKSDLVNIKDKNPVVRKPMRTVENKTKSNKGEYDMGYGTVEAINKTKENIYLFELCNFPQQIRKLLEAFDPRTSSS